MVTKRILFLDLDGVANTHFLHPTMGYSTIDEDKAERINRILTETGSYFVLISAWRYLVLNHSMTLEGMKDLFLSHWINGRRLVGITREDISVEESDRGQQINEWIEENIPNKETLKYLVMDDMDLGISSAGHPFIHVDGNVGLTDEQVKLAIERLA